MRVLVCGSRNYGFKLHERDHVFGVIEEFTAPASEITIIHGAAKGVDTAAGYWAKLTNNNCLVFPADWAKHGKAAGPIRNKQMLDEGKPDLVIAFLAPNSRGTKNMIEQAERAGVPVEVINID